MANSSYLTGGQTLNSGEYLVSPNGAFFLYMQPDGNLVVYHGTSPSNQGTPLWASGTMPYAGENRCYLSMETDGNLIIYESMSGGGGNVAEVSGDPAPGWTTPDNPIWSSGTSGKGAAYLAMQSDGNLVIYPGAIPSLNPAKDIWATNKLDLVTSINITSLTYADVSQAVIGNPQQAAPPDTLVVPNNSDTDQTPSVTGSLSYTQTTGWADTIETSITVTAKFAVGIPYIAKDSGEITLGVKNSYQWNGSTSTTQTVSWNPVCTVPPHSQITTQAIIYTTDISLPFTENADIAYQSGETLAGTFEGTYQGTGDYNIEISYGEPVPLPPDAASGNQTTSG